MFPKTGIWSYSMDHMACADTYFWIKTGSNLWCCCSFLAGYCYEFDSFQRKMISYICKAWIYRRLIHKLRKQKELDQPSFHYEYFTKMWWITREIMSSLCNPDVSFSRCSIKWLHAMSNNIVDFLVSPKILSSRFLFSAKQAFVLEEKNRATSTGILKQCTSFVCKHEAFPPTPPPPIQANVTLAAAPGRSGAPNALTSLACFSAFFAAFSASFCCFFSPFFDWACWSSSAAALKQEAK